MNQPEERSLTCTDLCNVIC